MNNGSIKSGPNVYRYSILKKKKSIERAAWKKLLSYNWLKKLLLRYQVALHTQRGTNSALIKYTIKTM